MPSQNAKGESDLVPGAAIAVAKKRAQAVQAALKAAGVPDQHIILKKPEQISASRSDAEARRVEISLQ